MKITNIAIYKDGGTIEIFTKDKRYCFDRRIGTKTRNELFLGYPEYDNHNIILDSTEIKNNIINELKIGKEPYYKKVLESILEE